MNRWITRLALAGKCGAFGISDEVKPVFPWEEAASSSGPSSPARPRAPKPMPQRRRKRRRVQRGFSMGSTTAGGWVGYSGPGFAYESKVKAEGGGVKKGFAILYPTRPRRFAS